MVVRGVGNVLSIDGGVKPFVQMRIIITFPRHLRRVVEASVAEEKVEASAAQIERMDGRDARGGKFGPDGIVGAFPERARYGDAARRKAVDSREGVILGLAVVPAEARKDAESFRDRR